MNPETKCIAVQ